MRGSRPTAIRQTEYEWVYLFAAVNAHTGEVVGERPYSVPKIVAAVVAGLIVVAVLLYFYARTHQGG